MVCTCGKLKNGTYGKCNNADQLRNVNREPAFQVNRNVGPAARVKIVRRDFIQTTIVQNSRSKPRSPSLPIHFETEISDPNFIGRTNELSDLNNNFATLHHIVVVCGLGGIGKTSIVRKFLEIEKFRKYNIVWINATQSASIQKDFEFLAKNTLGITTLNADGGKKDFKSITNEVLSKLCEFPTVIVLDNVDDKEVQNFARKFVLNLNPSGSHKPTFIITSRIQNWGSNLEHVIRVRGLLDKDAIALINKILTNCKSNNEDCLQSDSPKNIKKLAQLLQNFPLTIRQATAHIKYERTVKCFSITNYINEYNFRKKEYLDSKYFQIGIGTKYGETTYTTWRVTISAIEKNAAVGNLALRILRIIAYFEPDHIRRDIFFHLNHPLSGNIIDEKDIISSVRLLVEYFMIEGRANQSILSVHRLVQDVMKINLESHNTGMSRTALRDGVNIIYKALYENYAKGMKEDFTKIFEHAKSVFATVPSQDLVEEFLFNSPIVLETAYDYREYYEFGCLILVRFMNATKAAVANMWQKMRKCAAALRMFQDVRIEREQNLGEDRSKTTDIKSQIDKIQQHFDKPMISKRNCCTFLRVAADSVFGRNYLEILGIIGMGLLGLLWRYWDYYEIIVDYWRHHGSIITIIILIVMRLLHDYCEVLCKNWVSACCRGDIHSD